MAQAAIEHFDRSDCVIMTAAVCDYRPADCQLHKISKTDQPLALKLQRTDDILAQLAGRRTDQVLIGFAVQDRAARKLARAKMLAKDLDAIVLNGPAAFAADRADAHILRRGHPWHSCPGVRKTTLATTIVKLAEQLALTRRQNQ